jgi:hypothetical protein
MNDKSKPQTENTQKTADDIIQSLEKEFGNARVSSYKEKFKKLLEKRVEAERALRLVDEELEQLKDQYESGV